jgi:hypothetical protein
LKGSEKNRATISPSKPAKITVPTKYGSSEKIVGGLGFRQFAK